MSSQNFHHLFTGSSIDVLALREALSNEDITPIVKDENESARLAGFGMHSPLTQQVYVHNDEHGKALEILEQLF